MAATLRVIDSEPDPERPGFLKSVRTALEPAKFSQFYETKRYYVKTCVLCRDGRYCRDSDAVGVPCRDCTDDNVLVVTSLEDGAGSRIEFVDIKTMRREDVPRGTIVQNMPPSMHALIDKANEIVRQSRQTK